METPQWFMDGKPYGMPVPEYVLKGVAGNLAAGVAPGFWLSRFPEQPRVFRFGFEATGFKFRLSACVFLGALLRQRGYRVLVSCRGQTITALVRL